MQFDLSAVETATLVFIGTLVFALVIALFMMTASFAALVLVGVGRLAWFIAATSSWGLSTASTTPGTGWSTMRPRWSCRATSPASSGDMAAEIMGQPAPSTGTYPRVVLRDS